MTFIRRLSAIIGLILCSQGLRAENVTIQVRDADISEVIEMIATQQQVNILMSGDVSGKVSLSLYDMPLKKALTAIANTAGYALEHHSGSFYIVPHDQVGSYQNGSLTSVRVYNINYVDGENLLQVIEDHLSLYGNAHFIPEREVLVIRDRPEFLYQIDRLIKRIDQKPRQVLIEAKILEVTLNDDEALGIDWANLFSSDGGSGSFGVTGNAGTGGGFFFDLVTPNIEVALDALQEQGRLNTLSTPKLVALENLEASVVIGDRRGYQVTTTINQVTSESIEFLESGVILRVTAQIDDDGQVLMKIHPEVSTGTVDANGIPSQTTTEVTTNILVASGETIFIGGLIKQTESVSRRSVPGISRIPGLRRLFSRTESAQLTTETIVLIRPVIAEDLKDEWNQSELKAAAEVKFARPEMKPWQAMLSSDFDDSEILTKSAEENESDVVQTMKESTSTSAKPVSDPKPAPSPRNQPLLLQADTNKLVDTPFLQANGSCQNNQILFCYNTGCVCEQP